MASSTSDAGARHRIRSNLGGLEDLFVFLATVPEALEEQNARIDGLDGRIEEGFETVEELDQAYELLLENLHETERELEAQQAEVETLQGEVDDLRDDLEALRGLFSERVLDKEDAHVDAQKRDATEIVEVGDTCTVVINDTCYDDPRDPKGVARIEGLVTFVPAPDEDLTVGDEVEVRIADVGESHARAVRLEE